MRIFHFNDEERELHIYLAAQGHENTVLAGDNDPFPLIATQVFDAAFVGLHPHGLRLIQELRAKKADCFVTIITSDLNTRRAVEAMKSGAFDYLISPLDFTEVERTCIVMARESRLLEERRRLRQELGIAATGPQLIGTSAVIDRLRALVAKAAASRAPVLLMGETGTGKELVARMLHQLSPRESSPLVSINCNAIPGQLLESELFGYRKGAFTGADEDREGLLAQADGGTFFFDEIQDLDLPLQGKILRVLQDGEVLPLGSRKAVRLDVRFIAATNQNLPQLVRERKFREDLFYRLNVVPIQLPPLRERPEDIPLLAKYFLELYAQREGRDPPRILPDVWRWLTTHAWPGNVRELENICQRAVALAEGGSFDVGVLELTSSVSPSYGAPNESAVPASTNVASGDLRAARATTDRAALEQALQASSGNVSQASHALGISRTTFYAKCRQLGLKLPRERWAGK
jgi:two-component system, NtrC family, response regulator AtoC